MLAADYAKLSNQYMIIIDNSKYHTLATDKKATVLAYYDSILPEAEIDRIFELEHTYYYFASEQIASDYCFEWYNTIRERRSYTTWLTTTRTVI